MPRLDQERQKEFEPKRITYAKKRLEEHEILMERIGAGHIPIAASGEYIEPIRKFFRVRERRR